LAALLYLLIVVPTALLCGFWQAVIVSLSAVVAQSVFTARQSQLGMAADRENSITLLVFVLVALIVSRLSSRVTNHAREAESRGGQMHDLYEFTRRTLQMNLHVEPGPQLAELVHEIFDLEAVAVFDADLHDVYQAGYWSDDPLEMAQNVYYFETSDDDPETGIGRRVVRLGSVPIGSLVVRGDTNPLTNNAIASLIAITFDRYRAFANESRIETERRTEQLRATVLDSLAHAYKTPLTAIRAASTGLGEMGRLSPGQADLVSLIDEQTDLLGELLRAVAHRRPQRVVELGSGLSTLIIAAALRSNGAGRLISIDADRNYAAITRSELERQGLADWAEVRIAPLTESLLEGETRPWYDTTVLADLSDIDLLLIDGPPTLLRADIRYPALPFFWPRLTAGAIALLDDAARSAERAIAQRWQRQFPDAEFEYLRLEKGALRVIKPGRIP